MTAHLKRFIDCHEGTINIILHVIGLTLLVLGIFYKSLSLVIAGSIIQESGHFYQYFKTKNRKDSPWQCFKPQLIFAYPLFFLIILYVIYSK